MRISRTRHLKVNLGNYESFDFGATVTVDHTDLGFKDESIADLTPEKHEELCDAINTFAEEMLTEIMRGEIEAANEMTAETKSIVRHLVQKPGA